MGLNTQVIGKGMPNGQAGSYARQPDSIINTKAAAEKTGIPFGAPLVYDTTGTGVKIMAGEDTAEKFVGVACREVKSSLNYLSQGVGMYAEKEPVPVFMRGSINVKCQRGTPAIGGKVYVRTKVNESYSTAVVGGYEAEADTTNTVELPNCQWAGTQDANGIVEMRILTMNNA